MAAGASLIINTNRPKATAVAMTITHPGSPNGKTVAAVINNRHKKWSKPNDGCGCDQGQQGWYPKPNDGCGCDQQGYGKQQDYGRQQDGCGCNDGHASWYPQPNSVATTQFAGARLVSRVALRLRYFVGRVGARQWTV